MSFYTAVNCMDGRVQLPVINYLKKRFGVSYVDVITEAGPPLILAEQQNSTEANSILQRVDISINKHKSSGIAIVAHYDCAGNPAPRAEQLKQLVSSIKYLQQRYPNTGITGLWVDENWSVSEVENFEKG